MVSRGDNAIRTAEEDNKNQPTVGVPNFGNYDPPATVPSSNPVSVTAATPDGVTSAGAVVTIIPTPVFAEMLEPGNNDPQTVQVQPPSNKIQYAVSQTKNGTPDTSDAG